MSEASNIDKLIQAYHRMMERVKARLEEFEQAEKEVLPKLQRSIEHAAEKAVELGELTREEAQLISGYLKRDLMDAGHYLARTGHDLGEWLRFDLELIEDRVLDLFRSAADQTRLEMLAFQQMLDWESHYHTGEITGPGTLQCEHCGKYLHFHSIAHIPPCPNCHATSFSRSGDEDS
jgi:hypothetical protein